MSEFPPNPVEQVLIRIASAALQEGLSDFLLIGGNAVVFYGVPRFTRDVDFLIPAADDLRWRDFLAAQGFEFIHGTPGFSQFSGPDTACPRVDLMLVDASTWAKLETESVTRSLADGVVLKLPVVHHLIAMKLRAAASSSRANPEQDWSDIAALTVQHGYSLEDSMFRDLVERFGGPAALDTLRTRLDRQSTS
jgi:hypothetical protein